MNLNDFIKQNDTTEVEIAKLAGCSQSTINKVRRGIGNWTINLLARISAATGGQVTLADFITEEPNNQKK